MKDFQDDSLNGLFNKYYQREYDYDTASLTETDVIQIRQLAKEKRVTYGLAPIGENIFGLIASQCPLIRFETIDFNSDDVDAFLYIGPGENDKSYIVLNSRRPLVNQIFAAAHEYYHYIHDYEARKKNPCICDFKSLDSIMEKRASRFAAELLLPSEVLNSELKFFKTRMVGNNKDLTLPDYGALSIYFLIKYQLPLKSIFYRFHEEGILKKPVDKVIEDYQLIKLLVDGIVESDSADVINRLYSAKNPHINNEALEYKQFQNAYNLGKVTREEILEDAKTMNLDEKVIRSFFEAIDEDDEELSPEKMNNLRALWRK